jgi:excisionase family DNA binding protein
MLYYTAYDVSNTLGIHYTTAIRLMREGKIRAYRTGAGWRVPEGALEEYLEKCGTGGTK